MKKLLIRFLRDDTGEDLIEYGLLAAFVAAVAVAVIIGNPSIRTALQGAFQRAANALNAQ
jgi:Flp pilus assembly pilin Flp